MEKKEIRYTSMAKFIDDASELTLAGWRMKAAHVEWVKGSVDDPVEEPPAEASDLSEGPEDPHWPE